MQEKRQDILFLAKWAKDYSPFVALNEKYKNCPSVDSLKHHYLELAEEARDDGEFFHVANGYFRLIGTSGHASIPDENLLKYNMNEFRLDNPTDISTKQLEEGLYWARLIQNIPIFAHPPFRIKFRKDEYFVNDDWHHNARTVRRGARITKVNGLACPSYLNFIRQNTWMRNLAFNKEWIDEHLLLIDEGIDFKGWDVEFLLPDSSTLETFVPKVRGFPSVKDNGNNCICLEINGDVGYIRIKSFHFELTENDGNLIRRFLEKSEGNYRKLIIDIRDNGGGATDYFYRNLISPFLDRPVTYKQVAGIRRKFLLEMKPSHLEHLRKHVSTPRQGVTNIVETKPPVGFDPEEWIFYEITRKINPSRRYNFNGDLYILINENSFSAADDYANTAKRIGLGTLVGQNTGGGAAAYFAPLFIRLPSSGLIFVLEADLLLNADGTYNELFGTKPDIELDAFDSAISAKTSELLKDEWIRRIITEL
jgi:hypothetical protein